MAEVHDVPARRSKAVVAATKLHIPAVRPELIVRQSLIDGLISEPQPKLVLIEAPAGYGKTTLLAEWRAADAERRDFAWLSLDEGDGDPARFWVGVIEALRTLEPEIGVSALEALGSRNIDVRGVALPLLLNELTAVGREIVLILDDYHAIRAEEVDRLVDVFLDQVPPGMQVVIATRVEPQLSLARLRAGGEVNEIRTDQLRFSGDESAAVLRETVGLELSDEEVSRVYQRTEGWPAGLYLAGLSLRGRDDRREFIESFAGDDRHIVDYLSSEVLAEQSDELRSFLLETSVLGRLCGPLCDALTGHDDGGELLQRIERRNLFLIPLDSTRTWYRYHRLFGQLLQHELELTHPEMIRELHRRASSWYDDEGLVADAIEHAAASDDLDRTRDLIASHWNDYFNQGQLTTVKRWLETVPDGVVRRDPRLCVAGAWLALDRGRLEDARQWIDSAKRGVEDGMAPEIMAEVAVLRAVQGFKVAELESAREGALDALGLAEEGSFPHTVARLVLGVVLFWRGENAEASEVLSPAAASAESSGNELGQGYGLGYLGLIAAARGAGDEAARLGTEAIGLSDSPGFREHFAAMIGHLAIGQAAELGGRLDEAETEIRRAADLAARGAGRLEVAAASLALARVLQVRGDLEGSHQAIRDVRATLQQCPETGILSRALAAAERGMKGARLSDARDSSAEELTDREFAVLRLLPTALSRREIAQALYVSTNTVKTHVKAIYRKLETDSRESAVARARELGLL